MLVRKLLPKLHAFLVKFPDLPFYMWSVALSLAMAMTAKTIYHTNIPIPYHFGIAAISLVSCFLQFYLGRKIGGLYGDKITCGQTLGQKNTVLAIWLGYTFFTPITAIAGGFYSIWHNIANSYQLYKKKERKRMDSCDFKNFRAIHRKDFLLELIEEGEHEHQDFKFAITDSKKISRSIAAFANNDGGRLLIGVKDNGSIAGMKGDEEYYMIDYAASTYCKPAQDVSYKLYNIGGKFVLLVDIRKSDKLVYAIDESGKWKAYYRYRDENIQVPGSIAEIVKLQKSSKRTATYADNEALVLEHIVKLGRVTIDSLYAEIKLSRKSLKEAISNLVILNVVKLGYDGENWCILQEQNDK